MLSLRDRHHDHTATENCKKSFVVIFSLYSHKVEAISISMCHNNSSTQCHHENPSAKHVIIFKPLAIAKQYPSIHQSSRTLMHLMICRACSPAKEFCVMLKKKCVCCVVSLHPSIVTIYNRTSPRQKRNHCPSIF